MKKLADLLSLVLIILIIGTLSITLLLLFAVSYTFEIPRQLLASCATKDPELLKQRERAKYYNRLL